MSMTSLDKELQERLREASAIGDIDEVRTLVESGVNVNSQNEINGWTCLHWACKRNHKHIVSYLLSCGADKEILTAKDELASQLTSKPEIKRLLGVEVEEVPEEKEPELPIIPNYLSNPPFMYSKMDNQSDIILAEHLTQNGSGEHAEDTQSDSASLSPTHEPQKSSQSLVSDSPNPAPNHSPAQPSELIPVTEQNGVSPSMASSHNHAAVNCTVPMDLSVEPHLVNHADYPHAVAHNGTMCSPPLASPSPSLASNGGSQVQAPMANPTVSRQQSIPQQLSYGQASGPMPAFQPFFFTSTFPVNVQDLSSSPLRTASTSSQGVPVNTERSHFLELFHHLEVARHLPPTPLKIVQLAELL
ncbi:ankyrin repeat domain-containing protein 40 isoform X2 [Parambassis ranga]|uniref:Ankyrin repeat domain-containing protein 40 isoform X2 n=1 Tax=Parambassis ranga TaxID=210632 RepID=A0A6P7IPY5_9TELE|nr:ankyrin repeat domain-containing protein 40 isoform X2 [Parambassis ranga]